MQKAQSRQKRTTSSSQAKANNPDIQYVDTNDMNPLEVLKYQQASQSSNKGSLSTYNQVENTIASSQVQPSQQTPNSHQENETKQKQESVKRAFAKRGTTHEGETAPAALAQKFDVPQVQIPAHVQ